MDTRGQEHQVGRFLSLFEKRLAGRANLRTHGQGKSKIRDLDRAHGYRKVRRDVSRADAVPETALRQRRAARDRVLQEPLNFSVVHKRRDAHHEAAPGGPFLARTFDGVPEKVRDGVAKTLWREECLRGCCALPFCVRLKDAQEYRALVPEDGIEARPSHTHPGDEIVDRDAIVALRPEDLNRLFQRPRLVEAARASPRPTYILNHLV